VNEEKLPESGYEGGPNIAGNPLVVSTKIHPKIPRRIKFIALCTGLLGTVAGYGLGNFGGSPAEIWLWVILMGVSGCYMTLINQNASIRRILLIIAFHGLQIGIFVFVSVLIMVYIGPFGLLFGLRYGILLSLILGIFARDAPYEIPGGFFLFLGILICGGAGTGALIGALFHYDVGLCAVYGLLVAGLIPYYFLLLNNRLVFQTFIILTALGLQLGAYLRWELLQSFYAATISTFTIGLILASIDYIYGYLLKKPSCFGTFHLSLSS